jgi:hypothetical protein
MSYRKEALLLQVAMAVAFFGCLHAGEICVPNNVSFDTAIHVTFGDLKMFPDEKMMSIILKRSKTDRLSNGVTVYCCMVKMDYVRNI